MQYHGDGTGHHEQAGDGAGRDPQPPAPGRPPRSPAAGPPHISHVEYLTVCFAYQRPLIWSPLRPAATVPACPGDEMPLTPADVREKQFSTTRLRLGYDEGEVDAFLDEVEAGLSRLILENEALWPDLVDSRAGMAQPRMCSSPVTAAAPEPEHRLMPEAEDTPAAEGNIGAAARILAL